MDSKQQALQKTAKLYSKSSDAKWEYADDLYDNLTAGTYTQVEIGSKLGFAITEHDDGTRRPTCRAIQRHLKAVKPFHEPLFVPIKDRPSWQEAYDDANGFDRDKANKRVANAAVDRADPEAVLSKAVAIVAEVTQQLQNGEVVAQEILRPYYRIYEYTHAVSLDQIPIPRAEDITDEDIYEGLGMREGDRA